jgi:hypothetical protein
MIAVKSRVAAACSDRAMGSMLIGFVIGLAVGALTGTELGAFAGGVLGVLAGAALHGARWLRVHLAETSVTERHRVMCTPLGHLADVELVGEPRSGRWFDVRRCSLLPVADRVTCDKGCVRLLDLTGVRAGAPCRCGASATPVTARAG